VLVVDDEPDLRALLRPYLEADGYTVVEAGSGPGGLAAMHRDRPDLAVVDVMLPGFDGFELLRRIRESSDIPVILLTAKRAEGHRIAGLRKGADDYVLKPFSAPELVARVAAVLRRAGHSDERAPVVRLGSITIDESARAVTVAGEPVSLTRREFDLLLALAAQPGRVLTRAQLLAAAWDTTFVSAKTVDVHLAGLRRKLGGDLRVQALWGVGYRLDPP
jgi:DNA-binding response OmpR family regulator